MEGDKALTQPLFDEAKLATMVDHMDYNLQVWSVYVLCMYCVYVWCLDCVYCVRSVCIVWCSAVYGCGVCVVQETACFSLPYAVCILNTWLVGTRWMCSGIGY